MEKFKPIKLRTVETPVQILSEDFPRHHWPISGGWGYTQEDAVVIELDNSFEAIALEHKILEYRTYEEMIVFQPPGNRYAGFDFKVKMQALSSSPDGSRKFDMIMMEVSCFKEEDWEMLENDFMSHKMYMNDEEGLKKHIELRNSKVITFEVEGWFDITRFYGH